MVTDPASHHQIVLEAGACAASLFLSGLCLRQAAYRTTLGALIAATSARVQGVYRSIAKASA